MLFVVGGVDCVCCYLRFAVVCKYKLVVGVVRCWSCYLMCVYVVGYSLACVVCCWMRLVCMFVRC